MSAHDLAMTVIREVLYTTGITATAGIGTNLYLAMDITAKHAVPDKALAALSAVDPHSSLVNSSPLPFFSLYVKGKPDRVLNL